MMQFYCLNFYTIRDRISKFENYPFFLSLIAPRTNIGLCDCINFNNSKSIQSCEDESELMCSQIYNYKNNFLNCGPLSLHCAAPRLDNSIYTGGLFHTEKCVKLEYLCDGNADCLSSGK